MKKIITKPHLFFFALIPIVLIVGYVLKNESLNLNIYDSYFVATFNHISYFFATFLGLVGLNYLSLHWGNKKTIKWMTAAHIILQVFSLLLFFTKDNWNWLSKDEHPTTLQMSMDYSNIVLISSILIFILSAFIHLINFFVSLISKSK